MQVLTDEQLEKIAKVNEIMKELIPYNEKLKEFGLYIDVKEINVGSRFQQKLEQMIKDKNAKV